MKHLIEIAVEYANENKTEKEESDFNGNEIRILKMAFMDGYKKATADMENNIPFTKHYGKNNIQPKNKIVKYWSFQMDEEAEAELANALGKIAEKNGVNANTLQHLFPAILRMLKSNSSWVINSY